MLFYVASFTLSSTLSRHFGFASSVVSISGSPPAGQSIISRIFLGKSALFIQVWTMLAQSGRCLHKVNVVRTN